jgi:hypothetical protein
MGKINWKIIYTHVTLCVMTRLQAVLWSLLFLISGSGLLAYLLRATSPTLDNDTLNLPLITLAFVGLFSFLVGFATLVALLLQRGWPALGGGDRTHQPRADFALRQGVLLAIAGVTIVLLAFFQLLDLIFVIVILFVMIFIEIYWQQRSTKPIGRRRN